MQRMAQVSAIPDLFSTRHVSIRPGYYGLHTRQGGTERDDERLVFMINPGGDLPLSPGS